MISYEKNMTREPRENVKGGVGPYVSTHIFTPDQVKKTSLFARNVFPVGSSIGIHPHGAEGEAYIVLRSTAPEDTATESAMTGRRSWNFWQLL